MTASPGMPEDSAREALRVSEARYRRLFETARDGILLLNAETAQIEDVNPYLIEMLGYSHAEFLGKKLWEVGPFADITQSKEMFAVLQDEGYVRYDDLPLKTKRGARMDVEFVSNSYDCEGIKVIQCNIRDITARKEAERALQSISKRHQLILSSLYGGILLISEEGVVEFANQGFCKLFDIDQPSDQLSGLQAAEIMKLVVKTYADPQTMLARARSLIADGVPAHDELVPITGNRTYLRDFVPLVVDGEHLGRLWFHQDISDRKQAEDVLREFKAIVEASDDAIISKAMDGTIASWNPGAEKLFGYTAAEAIGKNISIIIPPEHLREEPEIMARLSTGERVEHLETVRVRKDGRLVNISATISPIQDHSGEVIGASKIARDITDRKHAETAHALLEAQLLESQKMEAIGTLAGGIAHDFNNIIAAILGNTELAREDAGPDNPLVLESLEEIRKAATRASNLVQQILSFSRKQPMERKRMSLGPVVEESVRLLRATLPARVALYAHLGEGVPEVMADATQVEQVLLNLATNAAQASGTEPQRIDISLASVAIDGSLADQIPELRAMRNAPLARAVRLTVRDHGPGIAPAILKRIFEPFFTTKPVGEGSGLGLSVVRGIVQSHEGAIVAESELGQGATFTMYFPALSPWVSLPGASGPLISGRGPAAVRAGRRLLYIDDDDALIYLVKRMLERRGYTVSGYTDAREALEVLRTSPGAFDLVVTDYNMPYLSGLEVARAVRNLQPGMPVGIASGFIDAVLLAQAADTGARELIVKAATVEIYCEAIERLAQSVAAAKPAA